MLIEADLFSPFLLFLLFLPALPMPVCFLRSTLGLSFSFSLQHGLYPLLTVHPTHHTPQHPMCPPFFFYCPSAFTAVCFNTCLLTPLCRHWYLCELYGIGLVQVAMYFECDSLHKVLFSFYWHGFLLLSCFRTLVLSSQPLALILCSCLFRREMCGDT